MKYPFPEHTESNQGDECLKATFIIPESYEFFEGHFRGNPLVPAVVQIGWAVTAMVKMKGEAVGAYRLSRFKFIAPIRPNDSVELTLTLKSDKFRCRITANGYLCCSGILELESND